MSTHSTVDFRADRPHRRFRICAGWPDDHRHSSDTRPRQGCQRSPETLRPIPGTDDDRNRQKRRRVRHRTPLPASRLTRRSPRPLSEALARCPAGRNATSATLAPSSVAVPLEGGGADRKIREPDRGRTLRMTGRTAQSLAFRAATREWRPCVGHPVGLAPLIPLARSGDSRQAARPAAG